MGSSDLSQLTLMSLLQQHQTGMTGGTRLQTIRIFLNPEFQLLYSHTWHTNLDLNPLLSSRLSHHLWLQL